jgi:type IV secretory pathway VirD2 relaxase
MARMEQDLGTKLDWVAVDHFNTGHPHSHILVRGKDERGEDLVIARDYMTRGLRERACELVDLDLGPRTMREVETVLKAEVEQERLTSLDRALLRSAGPEREVAVSGGSAFDQTCAQGGWPSSREWGLPSPQARGDSGWRRIWPRR